MKVSPVATRFCSPGAHGERRSKQRVLTNARIIADLMGLYPCTVGAHTRACANIATLPLCSLWPPLSKHPSLVFVVPMERPNRTPSLSRTGLETPRHSESRARERRFCWRRSCKSSLRLWLKKKDHVIHLKTETFKFRASHVHAIPRTRTQNRYTVQVHSTDKVAVCTLGMHR